jgi:magnesium chelatase family protein
VGGGGIPRPGEVSLAHNGVLFLDELPEFPRRSLEALRQPLEERAVTVARIRATVRLPARFQLVAAMNPCPCGGLGDPYPAVLLHAGGRPPLPGSISVRSSMHRSQVEVEPLTAEIAAADGDERCGRAR